MDEKNMEAQMEYQMVVQQLQQLQKQMEALEQQVMEMTMSNQVLEDLKDAKPGTEILIPIAAGIFAKATLQDTNEFILNVGAGTAVTKTMAEAKKLVETQLEEMQKVHQNMAHNMQHLTEHAQKLGQ